MKRLATAVAVLFAMAATTAITYAQQEYKQPCKCPDGYMVMWAGRVLCASQGVDQAPCPQGSQYDGRIEMCVATPDENRKCPQDMYLNNYGTMCLSEKREITSTCPRGGKLDSAMGLCIAPCVMGSSEQPKQEE